MNAVCRIYTLLTQPLLELGIQSIFTDQPTCQFAGTCKSLAELVHSIVEDVKDVRKVVLMDFVQDLDVYAHIMHTLRSTGNVRCLVLLFPFVDEQTFMRALRVGADGYVLQTAETKVIMHAVDALASNQSYLDPQMTPKVLDELRKPAYCIEGSSVQVDLTHRERMLMQLTADGLNNNQIADVLGLREKTIRNLWSTLFDKLGIYDRTLVVMWAIRTGVAELR